MSTSSPNDTGAHVDWSDLLAAQAAIDEGRSMAATGLKRRADAIDALMAQGVTGPQIGEKLGGETPLTRQAIQQMRAMRPSQRSRARV